MLLGDKTLELRFDELIKDGGSKDRIQRCAYMLLPDCVFAAGTATTCTPTKLRTAAYRIEPGAIVWVRTKEIVNIPVDLCGIWSQTNHYAQRGLMLINASIVEPGYTGPLTAALVNFGRTSRVISSKKPFARIMFSKLDDDILKPLGVHITRDVYDAELLETLEDAPATFLNIGSMHSDLVQKLKASLSSELLEAVEDLKAKARKVVDETEKEVESKVTKPLNAAIVFFAAVAILLGLAKELGLGDWVAKHYFESTDLSKKVDEAVAQSLGKRATLPESTDARFEALNRRIDELSARLPGGALSTAPPPEPTQRNDRRDQ